MDKETTRDNSYRDNPLYVKMSDNPAVDELINMLDDEWPKGHPNHPLVIKAVVLVHEAIYRAMS